MVRQKFHIMCCNKWKSKLNIIEGFRKCFIINFIVLFLDWLQCRTHLVRILFPNFLLIPFSTFQKKTTENENCQRKTKQIPNFIVFIFDELLGPTQQLCHISGKILLSTNVFLSGKDKKIKQTPSNFYYYFF